ncbi:glucose-6-phosphate dehydrogenase [Blochmannia endosymbiont of Camponotus (Colobopsis) obliquus]|uniref:glucose-6-phosphate dehydrogenase n=1 Tax=Blochmannia endosymbiont of Camponotus (Colobopsis) obliquus TaxID=1505597 RepID=UPI00061A5E53|nr:glucose-6-phosphate dehydrogenase [Blochmannia endosymbiont of Camponotus (Colobopsis) obliquus]AKC60605.1 Glucose-6-phosphate 1-dehydrogenase [Blochmannia endosymbiont of Camponotus (Colobopsis) obliquus]
MVKQSIVAQACNFIIFGAKGDLVRRKLLPSLYYLEKMEVIHSLTKIIAVGRANWNTQMYIEVVVRKSLETFIKESVDEQVWKKFSKRFDFCNLDVNHTELFNVLINKLSLQTQINIYYFAMPPTTFAAICKGLNFINLNQEFNRVVMEKPVGTDLVSAREINNQVAKYFNEDQIYRIDHYLGKETILNLLALRFANSLFISNWDHRTIDHVQITVAEEIGIEGRWGYFDKIGQMRDMIQSHLLQILTIVAMSPPSNLNADCIRDEKVKILQALRVINDDSVYTSIVRGQYTSGFIKGKSVPGYLEEIGANKISCTETFVSIKVNIDNWRWFGVPFYLRTGKRLATKYSEIVVYFKRPSINLFRNSHAILSKNKLTIRLQPDEGMDIQVLSKKPGLGHQYDLQVVKLDSNFIKNFQCKRIIDAYERLLLEMMCGIRVLFVRRDEVENAWRWVDTVVSSWKDKKDVPLLTYQAGTWGPVDSFTMLERDGRSWNICTGFNK